MSNHYQTLVDVFADVQDVRKARGKRYPLAAILSLAAAALMCGYKSYSAIAEWGRNYGHELAHALGFRHEKTPCAATFYNVFRGIDKQAFEAKLAAWAEANKAAVAVSQSAPSRPAEPATGANPDRGLGSPPSQPSPCPVRSRDAVAVDGKTLRGSQKQGATEAHLVSALDHGCGLTLRQQAVPDKTNEIPAVKALLSDMVLQDQVVTLDALLTQKDIAQQITDQGGDYLMIVKENQPTLLKWVKATIDGIPWFSQPPSRAQTIEVGHGRIEQRKIIASSGLAGYEEWPALEQVFEIQRTVTHKKSGQQSHETVYGITSLRRDHASAEQLLTFVRGHWHIENKSHWVRDVTFDEDRSQVRMGSIPQIMAALRNAVIGVLRQAGETNIAAACRRFAARPWLALPLLGLKLESSGEN